MLSSHQPNYFSYHINKEVKEVFWYALIFGLALNLTFLFEPIYLFKLGYSIPKILFFYVQVYAWYALIVTFVAKIISRIGYKHSILTSSIFYILFWLSLYNVGNYQVLFYITPLVLALQKSFFWPAYNADIALNSDKTQRGREVGALFSLMEIVAIFAPFIGGFISTVYDFKVLFIVSSTLILVAAYPLFKSPEIYTKHHFHFRNFSNLFKKYKNNFFAYWGYAEDLMLQSLWPIFIFITVPSVLGVGVVATIGSLMSMMLMLYVGHLADHENKKRMIKLSSVFYSLTWIFRFLAKNITGVLAFDVLTKTGKASLNVPMVSYTYEIAGDDGPDHAIAYSVFFEFSLAIGKIIMGLLGILVLTFSSNIFIVFAIAGLMTLLYGLLRK